MSTPISMFLSLPSELHSHILSFLIDRTNLSDPIIRNSQIQITIQLESISKTWNNFGIEYFNEFWWKVLECEFGISPAFGNELEILRMEMIRKGQLRRKVLLTRYVKNHLLTSTKKKFDNDDIKIVMLGGVGVGKSSVTNYFKQNIFIEEFDPTIEDGYIKQVLIDGIYVSFYLYDSVYLSNKMEEESYMREGEAFIIVSSVDNPQSTSSIPSLIEQLVHVKQQFIDMPIIFALNKSDLLLKQNERGSIEIVEQFRGEMIDLIRKYNLTNAMIVECSAKRGENVTEMYVECVKRKWHGGQYYLTLLKTIIDQDYDHVEHLKKKRKCLLM